MSLLWACGEDDAEPGPGADATADASDSEPDASQPTPCDPAAPDCDEYALCLQGADMQYTCKIPMCDLTGVGAGPCCDLRAPDGGAARGVCMEGQCRNSRDAQASERCAALAEGAG